MKCNYAKKLALFYHDASCLQSYTVLIDRVIIRDTKNKTPPNLIFFRHFWLSFANFQVGFACDKSHIKVSRINLACRLISGCYHLNYVHFML